MRIYFDSDAFIYYVEQVPQFLGAIQRRLAQPGARIVCSDLTRMECRVKPLMLGNAVLLTSFDATFAMVEVVPLTTTTFDLATVIRANHRFKTPDSIHLAAATEAGCDSFLTNDGRLARFTGIPVDVL